MNGVPADGDARAGAGRAAVGHRGRARCASRSSATGETVERTGQLQLLEDATGDPLTNPDTGRRSRASASPSTPSRARPCASGPLEGLGGGLGLHLVHHQDQRRGDRRRLHQQRGPRAGLEHRRAWAPSFNEVADNGLIDVLQFVGVISLALGIFNLLPILPLDGGHIVFALAEKVKGSAFSAVTYGRASFVGFAIVMLIFVIALQNDIGRLTGEGFQVNR